MPVERTALSARRGFRASIGYALCCCCCRRCPIERDGATETERERESRQQTSNTTADFVSDCARMNPKRINHHLFASSNQIESISRRLVAEPIQPLDALRAKSQLVSMLACLLSNQAFLAVGNKQSFLATAPPTQQLSDASGSGMIHSFAVVQSSALGAALICHEELLVADNARRSKIAPSAGPKQRSC